MRKLWVVVVLAVVITACGGDDDAGGGGSVAGGDWVEMLAGLPDTEETRDFIIMQDFERVQRTLDLDVPTSDASADELVEYAMTLTMGPVVDDSGPVARRSPMVHLGLHAFNGQRLMQDGYMEAWQDSYGFTFLDVAREAVTGIGRDEVTLWVGDFDTSAIDAAVSSDPVWSSDLERLTHLGAEFFCWGSDPTSMAHEPDLVRRLGQGGCLAVGESGVYRTQSRGAMEAAIEARVTGVGTLAGVEEFALVANALSDAGTYAAFLTADVTDTEATERHSGPFLDRYEAIGLGPVIDGDAELLVVAFAFADEETAAANVDTLEQIVSTGSSMATRTPWSEMLTIRSITSEGRLLVGVFEAGVQSRLWVQATMLPESLIVWSDG